MAYEAVIGLEVHAQLLTRSKVFCGCSAAFGGPPNSRTCPVCLGMPGVLPVVNRRAIEFAIRAALALGCEIAPVSRFARKNYFYPDLPKNYQISQYELPLARSGAIELNLDGAAKRVGIRRLHVEEDAGKLVHAGTMEEARRSFVDFNRCGVPLMEIVSDPDLQSPEEAAEYLRQLRAILVYMEEGSLRCDANVSVRRRGAAELGVRTEVKNMNSISNLRKALEFEILRQIRLLQEGQPVGQETRLWDAEKGVTLAMRSKEEAHDYRYFPDPDLVPLEIPRVWIEEIRASLPELPEARKARFVRQYGLPEYDAAVLTGSRALADYYEACVRQAADPKAISNWVMSELLGYLKRDGKGIGESPVVPAALGALLGLIDRGVISGKIAKVVFEQMYATGKPPDQIVAEQGLVQIADAGELERIVADILREHPKPVEDFRAGNEKSLTFLVGQVMKATKGKANPKLVNEILRRELG